MLIGSRAIAHWNSDFKIKVDSDWDIIGTILQRKLSTLH